MKSDGNSDRKTGVPAGYFAYVARPPKCQADRCDADSPAPVLSVRESLSMTVLTGDSRVTFGNGKEKIFPNWGIFFIYGRKKGFRAEAGNPVLYC